MSEQRSIVILRLAGVDPVEAQQLAAWVWRGISVPKARKRMLQATRRIMHRSLTAPYEPSLLAEELTDRVALALEAWGPRLTPQIAAFLLAEAVSYLGQFQDDNPNQTMEEELC